jgi:hypothetical protein
MLQIPLIKDIRITRIPWIGNLLATYRGSPESDINFAMLFLATITTVVAIITVTINVLACVHSRY